VVAAPTVLGDGRGIGRRLTQLFMDGSLDLPGRPNHPTPGWDGMLEVAPHKRSARRVQPKLRSDSS
jgi:hypothetical protein